MADDENKPIENVHITEHWLCDEFHDKMLSVSNVLNFFTKLQISFRLSNNFPEIEHIKVTNIPRN